jgi:hypothetical protein
MKLKQTFLFILILSSFISCGAQNNSGSSTDVNTNTTTTDAYGNITTVTTDSYGNVTTTIKDSYGNIISQQTSQASQGNQVCGTIFSQSDGFNIQFIFFTSTQQYNLQAGDDTTQALLYQMPPNVYAYNICGTAQISGSTLALRNISQN